MDTYTIEQKAESARDYMEWVEAYQTAGFTRQEALALMTRPIMQVTQPELSAETAEFMTKMNVLADDAISDR